MSQTGKILIADDESYTRESLRFITKKIGCQAFCCSNGKEALELLYEHHVKKDPFDLLLCDIDMPIMNGDDLLHEMKIRKLTIPALVITGFGNKELLIRLMQLGCRDFIEKPFTPDLIESKVRHLLENIRREQKENRDMETLLHIGKTARASFHDINNALGGALGFADILLNDLPDDHPLYTRIKKMSRSVTRVAEICIDQLSKDSEKSAFRLSTVDLNTILHNIKCFLEDIAPAGISINIISHTIPLKCSIDVWQLKHTLLNLGFNAIEAMPAGGSLTYTLSLSGEKNDNQSNICISIADSGYGMTDEQLKKIFDTGYTTRNRGYGIGLSNSRKFIEEIGGRISVSSSPGNGTCFHLNFPQQINTAVSVMKGAD